MNKATWQLHIAVCSFVSTWSLSLYVPDSGLCPKEGGSSHSLSYGFISSMRDAEYDHLISLQLDGDPNDSRNQHVTGRSRLARYPPLDCWQPPTSVPITDPKGDQ
ncbi:hypothetical protein [Streptomyces sp. NPDC088816]|uniref:hypothetical protein n=1 Tax=Streptomyces sp. NPDC088816 TaxID=3365906 RepID=UPI00381BC59F